MVDLSIIIVNWNTCQITCNCLESIIANTKSLSYEIILVDNGSSDNSIETIRSRFSKVTLIENSKNRGLSRANNQGIRIAKGRYVLFLNSDTIICENAVGKTVEYADCHPDVGIISCKVYENNRIVRPTCFRFPTVIDIFSSVFGLNKLFKYNRVFGRSRMLWWDRNSERQVDVTGGMFMLVRREAIDEVGLMDEVFFLLFEETDWCRRFANYGWKRVFWPGVSIIHKHGGSQSRKKDALRFFIQYRKSLLIYFRKYHGVFATLAVRLLVFCEAVTRLIFWFILLISSFLRGKKPTPECNTLQKYWWLLKFVLLGAEPKPKL